MEHIINWIITNKEWLFSGLGITIIVFVVKNFLTKKNRSEDKKTLSQSNSQTQNVTVNLAQSQPSAISAKSNEIESTALTIEGIKAQTNILFIDNDKKFKIVSILKKQDGKIRVFCLMQMLKTSMLKKSRMLISYLWI